VQREAAGLRVGGFLFGGLLTRARTIPRMVAEHMPAAVYVGDGEMTVRELAVPTLGPHDVLVEVSHCGICGTDLHLVLEKYARPDSVLGHEWAGTIAAVGSDVHGWDIGAGVVQDEARMRRVPRVPARSVVGVPAP